MAKLGEKRVDPIGPRDADIALVGEAPGAEEEKEGIPFVGRAGRFLDRHILRQCELEREELFIVNPVPYRPIKRGGGNAQPTITQIRQYRGELFDHLNEVHPKVIIAMGNTALHALLAIYKSKTYDDEKKSTGVSGITRWQGKHIWHPELQCWVIPTFHPSAVMRDKQEGIAYRHDRVVQDFEAATMFAQQKRRSFDYPESVRIHSSEQAIRLLKYILENKPETAYDLETEGFNPDSDEIQGVCLAYEDTRGFYIKWKAIVESREARVLFDRFLVHPQILKILHNGAFDDRFGRHKGLPPIDNWVDTMICAALVDENFPKGLKPLTWKWLKFGGYDQALDEYRREHKLNDFRGIPFKVLGEYGGLDGVATRQLWNLFKPIMKKEKLFPLFNKISMPVRKVMNSAEVKGFNVDTEYAVKLDKACQKGVDSLTTEMYEAVGSEFNPNSPAQLQKILFDKFKLKPLKKTKSGAWSTDKDSLKFMVKQEKKGSDLCGLLLDRKYLTKQQSTFIKLVLANVWEDGRIHTSFNTTGTVTGRASCSNPGIHNIPRDRLIRRMFMASEGNKLVDADIKSAELRMLAVYSGEPFLLDAFNEGRDLHNEVFNLMFGKSDGYVPTEDERFIAKAINFGLIYGRGAKSLASVLGVSIEEAEAWIALYFDRLPLAKKFLLDNIKFAHKYGYVKSIFGRRRRLTDINVDDFWKMAHAERQANNSVIQSAAAEYTYIGLIRVAHQIDIREMQSGIIHTVHDCLIADSPPDEYEELARIVPYEFERKVAVVPVKMLVDVEIEDRWGERNDSRMHEVLGRLGVIEPPAAQGHEDADDDEIFEWLREDVA